MNKNILFLALVFMTANAFAGPHDAVEKAEHHVLKIDFGKQISQGIILEKAQANGKPYYAFSLFASNTVYKTEPVPKGIFFEKYDEFMALYKGSLQKHKGITCLSKAAKVESVTDKDHTEDQMCREDFAKNTEASVVKWQKEIAEIVNRKSL